jgi:RNA polymerase sigma factor (sigma-70 family)
MTETSLSLLARASHQSADSQSWQALADVYAPLLRRWLKAYDVQDADADDLVQEVFGTLARELPHFQHNQRVGAFRAWLRNILVNRLRNFWRGRDQRPMSGGSSVLERLNQLADNQSQSSRLWDEEHDRLVMARLMELVRPRFLPKTWDAFHRQMFEGQSPEDVALELGMPLASVYVARSRVLAALRKESQGLVEE